MKEVWELALIKIWKLELKELEVTKSKETKILLKETNKLLKDIWSHEHFIEKDKDIIYILKKYKEKIFSFLSDLKKKKEKNFIDKKSHSYIKMELLLKKYNEELDKNFISLVKNIFSSSKREELLFRRSIIKQNIALFKAKKHWVWFSYTTAKKGYKIIIDNFTNFTKKLRQFLFYVIYTYIVIFIIFFSLNYYNNVLLFNYKGVFYFLILLITYFFLKFRVWIINISISFVFLFFIIIFSLVNF